MIPYARQWIDKTEIEAVAEVLDSEWLTQGPKIKEFEETVARYCGAKYAVAVNSGTAALHIASLASGMKAADEAITSPLTFVASANCILYCGAKPVFADVDDTINIDSEQIVGKINEKTKAIIPVHFAGHPCNMKRIKEIADKNHLIVIEDASHALGAEYQLSKIGSCKYSDMTVFSFHAVKNITTGEGGMVLTNNVEFYNRLLMLRTHGITRDSGKLKNKSEGAWYYEMQLLGFNYRITDFQCALGIQQMKRLSIFLERRRMIVEKYEHAFKKIKGITLPIEKEGVKSAWHLYVIQVEAGRREIFDYLKRSGIGVNVHYIPIHLQPYYRQFGYKAGDYPKAEAYYDRAITLPLFPKMNDEEIEYVIDKVSEACGRNSK